MRTKLESAAAAYVRAPDDLQAAIIEAAAEGENAPAIFTAINQAYSLDYVREIIGNARKAGKLPARGAKS